ncbi:hypothetical protein BJI49_08815 [Acetobacter pasteurianus]|nr:hypothetical protein BJI49_08815 [Acetobacter pasteurianus]
MTWDISLKQSELPLFNFRVSQQETRHGNTYLKTTSYYVFSCKNDAMKQTFPASHEKSQKINIFRILSMGQL